PGHRHDLGPDNQPRAFRTRPRHAVINTATFAGMDDDHGTEVASVVAAPVNHLGLVGVYPQAALRSWDASPFGVISATAAALGIVAAANAGPGVINMSFGAPGPDPRGERAIRYAARRGSRGARSAAYEGSAAHPVRCPA